MFKETTKILTEHLLCARYYTKMIHVYDFILSSQQSYDRYYYFYLADERG